MKKIIISFFAVLLITGCTPPKEEIDIAKEKEAITKVLYEEGEAFAANDLDRLFALYIQDETVTRFTRTKVYSGWDEIKSLYESMVEYNTRDTAWVNPRNTKENIILKVTGNTAWSICDNIWEFKFNNEPQKMKNIQIAFFEKINGEWKNSFNAFVAGPEEEDDDD